MPQEQEEQDRMLERWLEALQDSGLELAALAVVRREEASPSEAARLLSEHTAGLMTVGEARLGEALDALEQKGHVELRGGRYRITASGKRHLFLMLKQWNRYVDSMNNLWGCYYGT